MLRFVRHLVALQQTPSTAMSSKLRIISIDMECHCISGRSPFCVLGILSLKAGRLAWRLLGSRSCVRAKRVRIAAWQQSSRVRCGGKPSKDRDLQGILGPGSGCRERKINSIVVPSKFAVRAITVCGWSRNLKNEPSIVTELDWRHNCHC